MTISDEINPLNYQDWLSLQNTLAPEKYESEYFSYLKKWYLEKKQTKLDVVQSFRNDYIQLLKDLSYLFGETDFDRFLSELNDKNDEDLIYTIPFFAKKLKQIAIILSKKRESVKQAKLKYNLIGSNDGLEKILYEYILKSFTKNSNNVSQVPTSKFINIFPELSSVNRNFFIEVEELHDKKTYLGLDEKNSIDTYFNSEEIKQELEKNIYNDINEEELKGLISSQFLGRISDSTLSNLFLDFLNNTVPSLTSEDQYNLAVLNVYNQIEASKKYIGEPVYGLSAIKLKELNVFDNILNLEFDFGNTWFYWPSSSRVLDSSQFNNTFFEIPINDSAFVESGATAGDDYTNSDLIFTDKNGIVEGAWLRGTHTTTPEKVLMEVNVNAGEKKEFIFPFPGIEFSKKTGGFLAHTISDNQNYLLEKVDAKIKENILLDYFTQTIPTSSCNPIYLNNTTLISNGAHSAAFSTDADNVIKKNRRADENKSTYAEETDGEIEQAYLYRFDKTDLPITGGINNIYWPLQTYSSEDNVSLTLNNKFCLPVNLKDINVSFSMVGAAAGFRYDTSDIIYKFNTKTSDAMEAAWLGSGSVSRLDTMKNNISIYGNLSATKCASFMDGPVQSSLTFKAGPGEKISFIWMGEDTYADTVFKYTPHAPTCPYLKQFPHDYYGDQDYQNEEPINDLKFWKKCNCKSVNYSPIGHSGKHVYDFNGMADYLFADPDGLGDDFALNSWTDTRGFDVTNSPQFSFYQLDDINADVNVGWGEGKWKTGTDQKMVLKTGRRYTYYRTSLRTTSGDVPYFIAKFSYNKINGLLTDTTSNFDLVIIIDNSRSQSLTIEKTKEAVITIIDKILSSNKNVQVSLIEFNSIANRLSYLSNQKEALKLFVSQIQTPTDPILFNTNILNALQLAQTILTERVEVTDGNQFSAFQNLCSRLNYYITDIANGTNVLNAPQTGKPQKILIFSDGVEEILSPDNFVFTNTTSTPTTEIPYQEIELMSIKDSLNRVSENLKTTVIQKENLFLDGQKNLNKIIDDKSFQENLKIKLNYQLSYFEKQLIDLNLEQGTTATIDLSESIKDTNKNLENIKVELSSLNSSVQNNLNSFSNKNVNLYQTIKNFIIRYLNSLTIELNQLQNRSNNLESFLNSQSLKTKTQQEELSLNRVTNEVPIINEIIIKLKKQIENELKNLNDINYLVISSTSNDSYLNSELLILKTNYDKVLEDVRKNKLNLFLVDDTVKKINTSNISILNYVDQLKAEYGFQIFSVDIGYKSKDSDLMEKIASTFSTYFNLQNFLNDGDGNINQFIDYITMRIFGTMPLTPQWYKAVRDEFGNWVEKYDELGNLEISDMVLRPGDYISYIHKTNILYSNDDSPQLNFSTPCLSFTINVKLDGWDYESNFFSEKHVGASYGARPFWAEVYVRPNEEQNFKKENISFGGKIKFFDEYVPIQQPNVSKLFLQKNDVIEYKRNKQQILKWNQDLTMFDTITSTQWCKLLFAIQYSHLEDFLYKEPYDGVLTASSEESDLLLESYSSFKPAYYNYYARTPFTYNQGLLNKKRCENTFVIYNTSVIIDPIDPYANLYNNFHPSIASVPLAYDIVPKKQICFYHLPENLGHSFYRGRGYNISIDNDKVSQFKSVSAETIFFDLEKYGPRNRGLTKIDQSSIVKIDEISTEWIYEPYSSAERAGIMVNTLENQKFTPYQTSYEITNKNNFGVIRQSDEFQFWNPTDPAVWNDPATYPLTERKEIGLESYLKRKEKLLVDKGKLQNWRNDIFGSDYGLYKLKTPIDFGDMEIWFKSDYGILKQNVDGYLFDTGDLANDQDLIVKWIDKAKKRYDLRRYFGRPLYKLNSDNSKPSIVLNRSEGLDVFRNTFQINSSQVSVCLIAKFDSDYDGKSKVLFSIGAPLSAADLNTHQRPTLAVSIKENGLCFDFGNISDPNFIEISNPNFQIDYTKFHLFEMYFNQPNCYAYVDGKLFGSIENGLNKKVYCEAGNGIWLGSYHSGALSTACEISEIVLYKKYLNDRDKKLLRDYFEREYNFI